MMSKEQDYATGVQEESIAVIKAMYGAKEQYFEASWSS